MFKSIWGDALYQFRQGNVVTRLIGICVGSYLLVETIHLLCWASGNEALYTLLYHQLALPVSAHTLLRQPWSVVTFMFMHADFSHILFNMLWLYWFGEIYQLYMYDKRLLAIFLTGSWVGGALIMILSYTIPPMQGNIAMGYTVGASAGIFAILFAATALNPEHSVSVFILGQVPIKYIALGSFLISYVAITHGNAGGMIAHLGGAIFGYTYIKALQNGTDWFSPLDRLADLLKGRKRLKATYVKGKENDIRPATDNDEQRLNAILDKIAKSSYSSLSKEEKDFLFKYSNK